MVAPPLLAGGVKLTVALALPALAVPIAGAPGTVAGVTLLDAADAAPDSAAEADAMERAEAEAASRTRAPGK